MLPVARLVALYCESLVGRGLSAHSIKASRTILADCCRYWQYRDVREIGEQDILSYMDNLVDRGFAPASQQTYTSAMMRFFRWAAARDYLLKNPAQNVKPRKQVISYERPIPTVAHMHSILEQAHDQLETAVFELMYASGLRFAEAASLQLEDINLEARIAFVREGKGGKDRYVPFSVATGDALSAYITGERELIAPRVDKDKRSNVFLSLWGRIGWNGVSRRWQRMCRDAGCGQSGYTLHSIRHACATHLIEAGVQVRYVQELLGHASLSTTQRYTRPTHERIKAVYRSFHPRENAGFTEIGDEYRQQIVRLKEDLLREKEKKQRQHRRKT